MSDYVCPECGESIVESADGDHGMCLDCDWEGKLEDAAPDTSSPFDVRGKPPMFEEGEGKVEIHVSKKRPPIRLSPNKAENLAEALKHAARDARGHRDPEDSHI